jgi:ferredoxin/flavodoxin
VKTLIICFSQTGHTQRVAEEIRAGILKVSDCCDLVALADVDRERLAEYDLVGLGCPVFYYQPPFHVSEFIEGLPRLAGKQWFVFCSHGSVMGMTLILMAEQLARKGIDVIGDHDTYADGTLPFYPYPTVTTGHPDAQDLREAREFGEMIAERSRAVAAGDPSGIEPPRPVLDDWVPEEAARFTPEFLKQIMPPLRIDEDRCSMCGDCEDACPVQGIDIDAEPPEIQEPCIYCFHCVKICPTASIQADWTLLEAAAPHNYARYIEALHNAAERGEFRWLVDPDSMNFDDPLYKQRLREIEGREP